MVSKECRSKIRVKKHMKIRNRFSGTPERPRLAVFRSNNHMYAQIIDDTVGHTLVAASTVEKDVKALTKEEQKKIERYCLKSKRKNYLGIILCLYTGIRLGELL